MAEGARRVTRRTAAFLLAIAAVAAPRLHGQAPSSDAFANADAAVRAEMEKAGIPGASVAVVVADRVVWARGFGVANVETGAAVTPDTLFQIGSITKTFTAAAIVSAASSGALTLDRSVATYVSGLTECVGGPTLAQLLSHTAGVIDEPDEYGPQGEEGLGAYQRTWTNEYCLLPPGRAFSYSNSGYALAGLALQEVDKKPFADVMKARVLAPLGLVRTTFRPTEAMTWPLAVGHRRSKEGKVEIVRPLANDARLWPAGTLYSSANEMARFMVALMNDGKVDGTQALPPGVASRMRAAMADIPTLAQRYGQGLFLTGSALAGHGGTMTGYAAEFVLDAGPPPGRAEPVGIVVLTNTDGNPHGMLTAALAGTPYVLTPAPDAAPPAPRTWTDTEAARYVGTYRNPRRFTVEVVRSGAALVLKRFGRDFPMRPLETPGRFLVDLPRGGTETIAFGLLPDGRADYMQMAVWALARVPDAK
jgi:CubicO group peptidase (beta-lactamase class C family)